MIYRLTPRHDGRLVRVLLRAGESAAGMRTCGTLMFNVGEYRLFLAALNQGAAQLSPDVRVQVDAMGTTA